MTMQDIAAALRRVQAVLTRRPTAGILDDAPATAQWRGGVRVLAQHPNGRSMATDLGRELGGAGEEVSPGWLFRAGLASCAAARIAMSAAAEGIELQSLEVVATSRSDTRGLFGMCDGDGAIVDAGPCEVQLHVRIAAAGVAPQRLQELVAESQRRSPVVRIAERALPVALHVDVVPA